ncbi:hypothetical protein EV175_006328, partial [Coemansia sp. RSA 1933]
MFGLELPYLGSLADSKSEISRIQASFRRRYAGATTLVRGTDEFNDSQMLTGERFVQTAMNMLLTSISEVVMNRPVRPNMQFVDCSTRSINSKGKPDFVFVPAGSTVDWTWVGAAMELKSTTVKEKDVLQGQIGNYFNEMWRLQPRKYCIGLVSIKEELHILINTRDTIRHAGFGKLPFVKNANEGVYPYDESDQIMLEPEKGELAVRVLAMIFALDCAQCTFLVPHREGVFSEFGLQETMSITDSEETVLDIVTSGIEQAQCRINLGGYDYLGGRVMFPVGTTSWVHRAHVMVDDEETSHNDDAVVKFQWRRITRQTEKDMYDLLKTMDIPNIPRVIYGGRITTKSINTPGFVCDALVLESCGVGIDSY